MNYNNRMPRCVHILQYNTLSQYMNNSAYITVQYPFTIHEQQCIYYSAIPFRKIRTSVHVLQYNFHYTRAAVQIVRNITLSQYIDSCTYIKEEYHFTIHAFI